MKLRQGWNLGVIVACRFLRGLRTGQGDLGIRARWIGNAADGRGGEIIGTAARTLTVFTDGAGFYSARTAARLYTVKFLRVFLPAWRDKIGLHPAPALT